MLETYLPVLIFILIGIAFGCIPILLSYFVSPKKPDSVKCAPYECGFAPFEDARVPFQVKYYLIAILFILFDLETAFFFPWAVSLRNIGWFGFISMMIFLSMLVVGFIYEWKSGALEWE